MIESPTSLLNIRSFSLNYGNVQALRDITLSINKGDIVGVVGESGCGKSSLASAILRLLPENASTRGNIYFNDSDLYTLSDKDMRALRGTAMSIIFQDSMRAHHPLLSIGKQMMDIQYRDNCSAAEKLRRAENILQQVDIPDAAKRLDHYPHQFSGGMLQRIAIAMALMSRPDLLIADEATTALDVTLEVRVIDILRQLQQDIGCAILFISHHLGAVRDLCDWVAVMYAGEIVEYGIASDVFDSPRHPYTRRLLQCDPARAKNPLRHLPTISGDVPELSALPSGCAFAERCTESMPSCTELPPPMVADSGGMVRCWLHEKA